MAGKDRFNFWQQWLYGVTIMVILLGLLMAFVVGMGMMPSISGPLEDPFYSGTMTGAEKDFRAWTFGVVGATMVGWGIMLTAIVKKPFANKERWSWAAVITGLSMWYVIDTGFSLNFHVTMNAALNTVVFLLALVPLVFTYKEFNP